MGSPFSAESPPLHSRGGAQHHSSFGAARAASANRPLPLSPGSGVIARRGRSRPPSSSQASAASLWQLSARLGPHLGVEPHPSTPVNPLGSIKLRVGRYAPPGLRCQCCGAGQACSLLRGVWQGAGWQRQGEDGGLGSRHCSAAAGAASVAAGLVPRSAQPCSLLTPHPSSPLTVTRKQAQLLASPSWSAACAVYQPTAAAAAPRPYASSALESLQEAAAKIRKAAASSAEAVKSAGSSISHAPDAVYNALPKPAQQLVNAAQVCAGLF